MRVHWSLSLMFIATLVTACGKSTDSTAPVGFLPRGADARMVATSQLPIRGLWGLFEEPGVMSGYDTGQVIIQFNDYDGLEGRTVSAEVAQQLDMMKAMGVNTITYQFL